jgi:tRNA threonylcarbamoyl adenosine modification protein (Sua5/YciO/YrdC/YwlC family)
MAPIYDCSVASELLTGMRLARMAIGRGELIVVPTDTVYGIGCDAFNSDAVARLLAAKGRTRQAPPPVLIPGIPTLDALAEAVPEEVRALVAKYWPGGLTVIVPARESLTWDLGETRGTVALRMPANPIVLDLLSETGPLAVSSANLTGMPPAVSAVDAQAMLGDSVSVYLDDGAGGTVPSTIVDATGLLIDGGKLRIVREGVIPSAQIRDLVGPDKCLA